METTRTFLMNGVDDDELSIENCPCVAVFIFPTFEPESLANWAAASRAFLVASAIIAGFMSLRAVYS